MRAKASWQTHELSQPLNCNAHSVVMGSAGTQLASLAHGLAKEFELVRLLQRRESLLSRWLTRGILS